MSDKQLEDYGFSRTCLLQGVQAYPWRTTTDADDIVNGTSAPEAAQPAPSRRTVRSAVKELSSYSDRELAELDITRNTIEDAVRHGRPMIGEKYGLYKNAA